MTQVETERREAWRGAVWLALLNLGCGLLAAIAWHSTTELEVLYLVHFALSGAIALALALMFRRASRNVWLVLFSLELGSTWFTVLHGATAQVLLGVRAQLFYGVKAAFFVIAILSPSLRLGLAWIAVFSLTPVLQVLLWPPALRAAVPPSEPWFTPIYGCVAAMLLYYRRRGIQLERALANARADHLTLVRVARISLLLRDLSNTPLQTLASCLALLRHRIGVPERVTSSMASALNRLEQLQRRLGAFDKYQEWHPQDEGFDAPLRLDKEFERLTRPP